MPEFFPTLEKTEGVARNKKVASTVLPIQISEAMVLSKPAVKYCGNMINTKNSFFKQIRNITDKAAAWMFVVQLILHSGSEVCARSNELYWKRLLRRLALQVMSAYHTVFGPPVKVTVEAIQISKKARKKGQFRL